MSDRYFVDQPISADRVTLAGAEAHHLIHVMRAAPGLNVTLFDGGGDESQAIVERVGRAEIELTVLSREHVDRELPFELTLAVALPKGERQRWLVEKAVELGTTRIVPLLTRRTVAQPNQQAIERLRRTVVEASKQCGRNRLMQIDPPQTWPDFIADNRDHASPGAPAATAAKQPCRLLAHVGGPDKWDAAGAPGDSVLAAVGPEGGFTDDEAAAAVAAGWQPVGLGPRILRVETAAMLLAAIAVRRRTL
jgi:16S rRNA (uracil1498-N3)-methyltransferase